ncbi:hypothetical protein B1759_18960 [Rubrivirga sp. SAORIC476]|uniref:hypothetical protein n=1 Tax=Rubrivirga sp. SAORIC476 TaxID=1961794 RepID=UPI000BA9865C|nr:hypothetical protein [Rubrivirga sp. SAORIC476]PAP74276.1 hypothetical protein B1759_18960 [Rubrivirga sp. SAORIC476]
MIAATVTPAPGRRLDTVSLRIPADGFRLDRLPDLGHPGVSRSAGARVDGSRFDRLRYAPGDALPGVNALTLDDLDGSLSLDVSAKALRSDYARGIGPDTLDALASAVTSAGFVRVDAEGLLSADVRAADVFLDVTLDPAAGGVYDAAVGARVGDAFDALRSLRSNPGFRFADEGGNRGASLRFRTARRRGADELGIYAKGLELAKPANRAFMAAAGPKVYRDLAGAVRFERRAKGPSLVKRFCSIGIHDPYATLADVLTSTARPVSDLFLDVRGDTGQRHLFDTLDRIRDACPFDEGKRAWGWIVTRLGLLGICEALGWDYEAARDFARDVIGSRNAHTVYGDLRDFIDGFHAGPDEAARARTAARLDALASTLRTAEDRAPVSLGIRAAGARSGGLPVRGPSDT